MFHKNFKLRCFFTKIHFMGSQINEVHSPTTPTDWRKFELFDFDQIPMIDHCMSTSYGDGKNLSKA